LPEGVEYVGEKDDKMEFRVEIPLDDDGFFGRQCPACDQVFRVFHEDYEALPDELRLWCVYCGDNDDHREIFDYRIDQLGVKDGAEGFLQIEGAWYCPSMPDLLVNATLDFRNGLIDEGLYLARLEERTKYRARPNGRPDEEGHQRIQCPAAGGGRTARCPVKAESMRSQKPVSVRITPKPHIAANPPKACSQRTVTIAPEQGAKFAQDLAYGTDEWLAHYSTLRNSIEGMNGYVKDGAHEALAESTRRRIRGVAAQSVFAAFLLFAANLRKIDAFLAEEAVIEAGSMRRLRRRRKGRSLQDYRPVPGASGEPPPSAPD
jgi:hypothetical protein